MKCQVVVGLIVLSLIFIGQVMAEEKMEGQDHYEHGMAGSSGDMKMEEPLNEIGEAVSTVTEAVTDTQSADANAPVVVGNKFCPVSGEKVGQMGKVETIEYNGKIYNLCCAMCAKDFNKDPEKYSKIAEEEAAGQSGAPEAEHQHDHGK